MKATDVMALKSAVPVVRTVNESLKKLRKKLKVGGKGGMTEREWYVACADALVLALEHVENNLRGTDGKDA